MSERIEARGDIGQVIGGNVHEAPRQSNVVNFLMGGDKAPVETLTDLQRKRIGGLVKDLCAITQEKPLDIYRVILTDFGAERMKDMPRAKYLDIVSQIERWIVENTQGQQKTEAATQAPIVAKTEQERPSIGHSPRCDTCSEKDISYARLQRLSRGQWALLSTMTIVCGLLLYRMPAPADDETASTSEHHCIYEGRPYSVGSMIRPAGGLLSECVATADGRAVAWLRAK